MTKRICLLGATGSIGESTLSLIRQHPDKYQLVAASAHSNVAKMADIAAEFQPSYVAMADQKAAAQLKAKTGQGCQVGAGEEALCAIAALDDVDVVVAAIVGTAGLPSALAAAKAGKTILLANKESLVVSGEFFMKAVKEGGATLLPVDSEHNAIFQCLPNAQSAPYQKSGVSEILLTASGGPFRGKARSDLESVTPEQAVAHPNWNMGKKISVDSATLMNKGLELIEACWLFDVSPEKIDVVVHPQSVIHSMVRYEDGSVLAQLGSPDMRIPIAYGLAWPERIESGAKPLDLAEIATLNFEKPDHDVFPCLSLAKQAFSSGNAGSAVLNAANEATVNAFLEKQIGFLDIPRLNEIALERFAPVSVSSVNDLYLLDSDVRAYVKEQINLC